MDSSSLDYLVKKISSGQLPVDAAVNAIKKHFIGELPEATIDNDRERRTGVNEVIFGAGKSAGQIIAIAGYIHNEGKPLLITRLEQKKADAVLAVFSKEAMYNSVARTLTIGALPDNGHRESYICVVTAGTSDLPVAEEAVETIKYLGCKVKLINDVGVAGIHRLFNRIDEIKKAKVVVVVAGMEGALASVVAGQISAPLIAVPTSVGYGASFNGLAALLTMLNSCASGISVVNIDNGFGAGYQAAMIDRL